MGRRSIVIKRLKEARDRARLSQRELGVKAGMDFSGSRMNQYENDVHGPDLTTMTTVAKALKVPVPYLYCEDDELARVILRFSELGPEDKKRVLVLLGLPTD
jgi:transcriptional regulator with XRE-family HTH domain